MSRIQYKGQQRDPLSNRGVGGGLSPAGLRNKSPSGIQDQSSDGPQGAENDSELAPAASVGSPAPFCEFISH